MNKTLIALLISSVVLAGCGKSDEEIRQEQAAQAAALEQIAQQNAKAQQEADELELAGVVAELKKGDPLIKDAYYGYNEKGDRVLHVVRENPPEPVQAQAPQYQQGANGQPVIINNQPAQQASSGVSESVWPLLAGAGAGMLLANAMNSSGGYNNYQQSHRPYSNNYYSDNDYRRERTKVVNNYHTTVIKQTREVVRKDPVYKQRASDISRVQPAVKSNTAASFGQSRIQSSAQPSQFRQPQATAPKPAVKPASSGWGLGSSSSNSTSSSSKPVVKSNSGGWGSSSNSSSSSSFRPSSSSKSSFSSGSSSSRSSGFSSSRSSSRR